MTAPKVVASSFKTGTSKTDPIAPVEITHSVDEIVVDGQMQARYNYLAYHFEVEGDYCRARTYLNDIGTVSVYGPFAGRGSRDIVEAPQFFDYVMSFLKRRFLRIDILGEEGYVTIWEFADSDELDALREQGYLTTWELPDSEQQE